MSEIQVGQINSTDGSTAITTSSGNTTVANNLTVTGGFVPSTQIGGRRNLIINGAMQVAQRGTSFSISGGNDAYTLDRWYKGINSSGSWTITQDTDVPSAQGFNASWKADCTATGSADQQRLIYKIEGYDTNQLAYGASGAKTVTLSFWVKSNKTGSAALSIETYGGASSRYYNTAYTISSADTWEYKTITISGDTASGLNADNSLSYLISWWFSAGSSLINSQTALDDWTTDATYATIANGQSFQLCDNTANYVNITGVQLEVGTVATPFEHRSYGEEMELCKRYFERLFDDDGVITTVSAYNSSAAYGAIYYAEKRTSPSMSDGGSASPFSVFGNNGAASLDADDLYYQHIGNKIGRVGLGGSYVQGYSYFLQFNNSSAYIDVDAEL